MVAVYERTGSVLQTVGVSVVKTVPILLIGPHAGAIVDRYSRKTVLVLGDVVRAGGIGSLFLFVSDDAVDIWGVYAVVAGLAAATAFHTPASRAIIPTVVDRRDLVQANSLLITSKQTAQALGFAAGGVLFLSIGFVPLLMLDGANFIVSGLIVSTLSLPKSLSSPSGAKPPRLWTDIVDGLVYLNNHKLARSLVVMEVLEHVPHAIWSSGLMLAFTVEALNADVDGWGFQNASFYLSQIAGAILAGTLLNRYMQRHTGIFIVYDAFIGGVCTIGYGLSPRLSWALVACVLMGPLSSIRDIAQDALLQTHVNDAEMGRVFSTKQILTQATFSVSGLVLAGLVDLVSVRWIYVMGGSMYVFTGSYALLNRHIRTSSIESAVESA